MDVLRLGLYFLFRMLSYLWHHFFESIYIFPGSNLFHSLGLCILHSVGVYKYRKREEGCALASLCRFFVRIGMYLLPFSSPYNTSISKEMPSLYYYWLPAEYSYLLLIFIIQRESNIDVIFFFCIMNMVAYKLPIFSPGIALERQSKPPWIRTVRVHVKKATYYYYRAEIG